MSDKLQLVQVTSAVYISHVRQLFSEYVQLLHEIFNKEYAMSIDIDELLQMFMKGIDVSYYYEGYSEFKTDEL